MGSRFVWSMALRHLRFNIGQTLLTMAIVAVSVILLILLSTLTRGIQSRIFGAVTESVPHITIKPLEYEPVPAWNIPDAKRKGVLYVGKLVKYSQRTSKIEDWAHWLPRIRRFDPNIKAVSPSVESQAILFRGAMPRSVTVVGMIPRQYNQVVEIESKLVKGRFFGLPSGHIVVGRRLADDMAVEVGDKLRLVASGGQANSYTVAGIFYTGMYRTDRFMAFVPLRDAQSLFGLGNAITSIAVKIEKIFEANRLADLLAIRVPYDIHSWMRDSKNLLTAMQSQELTFNLILLLTTIAAGFAIASILIMSVVSKLKELGILKAMGATRKQILQLITFQGSLLALLGALLGTAFSVSVVAFLQTFETRDAEGFVEKTFSLVELNVGIVGGAIAIAVLVGFLASLYPAWRAARVDPIEVIRGA